MLDKKFIDGLCIITDRGVFPHHAAATLGVKEATFRMWMEKGKREAGTGANSLYAMLFTRVDASRSKAIAAATSRLVGAGEKGIWQADARFLESAAPADFIRTEKRINEGGDQFRGILDELKLQREKAEKMQRERAEKAQVLQSPVAPQLPVGAVSPLGEHITLN